MADEQERATRPDLWGEGENTWHDMMIEQGIHDALPREERVDFYAKRQQEVQPSHRCIRLFCFFEFGDSP